MAGKRLISEILRWQPDVLCLQEVDACGFLSKRYFEEALKPSGYVLAIDAVKKTGNDGCCVFVRMSLHSSLGLKATSALGNSNQVAAMVHLQNEKGLSVLIGTTHFKAKKGHEETRRKQSIALREMVKNTLPANTSCIICGDFNADSSEPAVVGMRDDGWKSAYTECCGNEPYSTWKIRSSGEVKRCIDYIWLQDSSNQNIWVDSCVLPPTDDAVGEERFPSWQFPSDHVNLIADLDFYIPEGNEENL